jgi:hypothetical protein
VILEVGLPELKGRRDVYDQLARDLDQRGLADGGPPRADDELRGLVGPSVTCRSEVPRFITLDP